MSYFVLGVATGFVVADILELIGALGGSKRRRWS